MLNLVDLHAKLRDFGLQVRANRIGCSTRFARVVHDRLIDALDLNAQICLEAQGYERRLRVEADVEIQDALHQALGDCLADLDSGGRGFHPSHLLDHVDPDWTRGGYVHPAFNVWCSGQIPEWMTVEDVYLCGLGPIIRQIAEDTGFRFTTYLCQDRIGPEGAGSLDPEIYEKPARPG